MKRWLACMATLGALALATVPAKAELYYGFTVGVAKAPPAPVLRYATPPDMVLASDAMVFVLKEPDPRYPGDLFRYGQYWFAYTRGYWYRARDCKGPYSVIDVRNVPRAVLYVPRKHWKHHPKGTGPGTEKKPALASAGSRPQVVSVRPYPPGVPPPKPYVAKPARRPTTKSSVQKSSKDGKKKSKKDGEKKSAGGKASDAKQVAKAPSGGPKSKAKAPTPKADVAKATSKQATAKGTAKSATAKSPTAKSATAKSATAKSPTAKSATAKSATAKNTTAKSPAAKSATAKNATAKNAAAKNAAAKNAAAKAPTAKNATAKDTTAKNATAKSGANATTGPAAKTSALAARKP